jgi:hypothetical protein
MTSCTISHLWSGESLKDDEKINISVAVDSEVQQAHGEPCLVISVDAPFYDNAKPQVTAVHQTDGKGCLNFEGLWNFEVVEVFIKGRSDKYLEIEMGPHGHYLILACDGYRQCFTRGIEPISYSAIISNGRWTGRLVCPLRLLPPPTDIRACPYTFNAYAIHSNSAGERVYCTAFLPPRTDEVDYSQPDFHKLELFQPLDAIPIFCASQSSDSAPRSIWENRPSICVDMGAMRKSSTDLSEEEVSPRE